MGKKFQKPAGNNSGRSSGNRQQKYGPKGEKKGSEGKCSSRNNTRNRSDDYERGDGFASSTNPVSIGKVNDPLWYAIDQAEIKRLANLSWANASGLNVKYADKSFTAGGICAVDLFPSPGISTEETSALNVAARNIYSFVRHANSGSANYDAPDLMMYLLAMDGIYSMFGHLQRALGSYDIFNTFNRYYPKALCAAMGFDSDDIAANKTKYTQALNYQRARIDVFHTPRNMPIYMRHMWSFTNVYRDGGNDKSQLYLFRPSGYYVLNEFVPGEPGKLEYTPLTYMDPLNTDYIGSCEPVTHTFDYWLDVLDKMITPIITSEAFQIMNGDIMKAYGNDVWTLSPVEDDYRTPVVFEPMVLEQISNAIVLTNNVFNTDIAQDIDHNIITFDPSFWFPNLTQNTKGLYRPPYVLNLFQKEGTPEEVLEATRLMVPLKEYDQNNQQVHASSMGADFATQATLYTYNFGSPGTGTPGLRALPWIYWDSVTPDFHLDQPTAITSVATAAQQEIYKLGFIRQFRFAPQINVTINLQFGTSAEDVTIAPQFCGLSIDLDNYTTVDGDFLDKVNETALMRLYGIR